MYEAEGYAFYTKKDAELASQEQKRAEYLRAHLDFENPESVLRVYRKAVAERMFKTPVGVGFLKEMQRYLLERKEIDPETVPPISLYLSYDNEERTHTSPAKNRLKPAFGAEKKKQGYRISVILNIALVIAVIAMFVITLNAEQPNIINYERAILNRYADWEQQLTQREQVIREKERELLIQTE
ncbi:MAG: hypothetical protein J6C84_03615 [Lachnospiraceae bacterium]|nr:hypothetical protein [Lachnospiraceae bacterium]